MRILKNNKGSATIESCFIIPIIIVIIFGFILLYIDEFNEAIIQGNSYSTLFALNINQETDVKYVIESKIDNALRDSIQYNIVDLEVNAIIGKQEISIQSQMDLTKSEFTRLKDETSEKLRRWQFYGNFY